MTLPWSSTYSLLNEVCSPAVFYLKIIFCERKKIPTLEILITSVLAFCWQVSSCHCLHRDRQRMVTVEGPKHCLPYFCKFLVYRSVVPFKTFPSWYFGPFMVSANTNEPFPGNLNPYNLILYVLVTSMRLDAAPPLPNTLQSKHDRAWHL
jgi:hypothetical protein